MSSKALLKATKPRRCRAIANVDVCFGKFPTSLLGAMQGPAERACLGGGHQQEEGVAWASPPILRCVRVMVRGGNKRFKLTALCKMIDDPDPTSVYILLCCIATGRRIWHFYQSKHAFRSRFVIRS
jgi:hypothetical protein